MRDTQPMHVLQTWYDLSEVIVGLAFVATEWGGEVHAAVHDVIEEFSVLGVFHDDEDPIVGLDYFVELGYRRMPDQF